MSYIAAFWGALNFWTVAICAIFGLFCLVLYRLNNSKVAPHFYFHDFFSSGDWNGKASAARLCYFGAFLTHSLVLLHQEMKREGGADYAMASLFALIWSGAYVVLKAMELKSPPNQQPPEGETK